MKILESYKKIAKSMLIEHAWDRKFGEPLPTLKDVMKEAEKVDPDKVIGKNDKDKDITVQQAMDYSGDNETMNTLKKKAQVLKTKGGEDKPEEPASKLGGGDFERPDTSEPEDKPFGGDTGKDADSGGGDFTKSADYDMWSDEEPEGDEEPSGEPKGDSDSEHASKIQSVSDGDEIETLLSMDSDFRDEYEAIEDENSGYKDDYGKDLTIDDLKFKIKMIAAGEDPEDFLGDFNDEDELVDAWKDSVGKAMVGEKEESITINGKKYRPIKDSVEPKKHLLREMYEKIGGK